MDVFVPNGMSCMSRIKACVHYITEEGFVTYATLFLFVTTDGHVDAIFVHDVF